MFSKVSYRRGVIEGVILFTLGRLGALITPSVFPDWTSVAAPLIFMTLEYILAPFWATRRIAAPKRERLSKRFWLLGPLLAAICVAIDLVITLACGLPISGFLGVQRGPVLLRLLNGGPDHLTLPDFAFYEIKTVLALFAFYTMAVVCTRLSQGGFLRFTMPADGNRVTL